MKIWTKTTAFSEGKFLVVRRDGTVPHWPHFVMGARDPFAPAAIEAYAAAVQAADGDREYVMSLYALAEDFRNYRKEHGDGDPWASPHRHDNPRVIAEMRGEDCYIHVLPDTSNVKKNPSA